MRKSGIEVIVPEKVNEEEKRTKKPDRSWFRARDGESCMHLATPPGGLTPGYHRLLDAAITASKKPPFTLLPQPPSPVPPRNPSGSRREDSRETRARPWILSLVVFEIGPSARWKPFRKIQFNIHRFLSNLIRCDIVFPLNEL